MPRGPPRGKSTWASPDPRTLRRVSSYVLDALSRRLGDVQKATLVKEPPADARAWTYELKWDGYRILALKSGPSARLVSRNARDWTSEFPGVARAVEALAPRELALDGEVCAL